MKSSHKLIIPSKEEKSCLSNHKMINLFFCFFLQIIKNNTSHYVTKIAIEYPNKYKRRSRFWTDLNVNPLDKIFKKKKRKPIIYHNDFYYSSLLKKQNVFLQMIVKWKHEVLWDVVVKVVTGQCYCFFLLGFNSITGVNGWVLILRF